MMFLTPTRRRGHWLAAVATGVVATFAIAMPANAQTAVAAGGGTLVGTISYSSGIPANMTSCASTSWSLQSVNQPLPGGTGSVPTAGGFVDTGGNDYAGGLSFTGSDALSCEAGWGGNGTIPTLNVQDSGIVIQGSSMSCQLGSSGTGTLKGGVWIRTGVLLTLVAWGNCTVHNVPDGTTFFAITGNWTPTSVPNMSTPISSAALTAAWTAG